MIWLPGICAFAVGAAFALAVLRASPRAEEATDDEVLARHEHDLALSLDQLRELSVEEHLFDPATYASERSRIEQVAAAAMKARDTHVTRTVAPSAEPTRAGFARRHPQLTGALWGAGLVSFVWALSAQIQNVAQPRESAFATPTNYEAMLVLSAIALETGDANQFLQAWSLYMRQPEPRRRPPQLRRATDWLEEQLK